MVLTPDLDALLRDLPEQLPEELPEEVKVEREVKSSKPLEKAKSRPRRR